MFPSDGLIFARKQEAFSSETEQVWERGVQEATWKSHECVGILGVVKSYSGRGGSDSLEMLKSCDGSANRHDPCLHGAQM